MNKKILIGSIIAVVLLTLVSFSSVVGYNSVKSDSKITSPLFGIRTNRAINNKQDAVTTDYIGKGKTINILLPKRNDNVNLMYRKIDFISKANDKTFERYLDLICSRLRLVNDFTDEKIDEIVEQFRYIREYPDEVKSVVVSDNIRNDFTHLNFCTFSDGSAPLICFVLGCIVTIVMEIILFITHTSSLICTSSC